MSLFPNDSRIDDIPCGVTAMGGIKGVEYQVTFEREHASLEQIEAINWKRPRLDWKCPLPKGCGFEVADIRYSMGTRSYTVTLRLKEQYLGDVTRYQEQIDALEEDRTRLESDSANLQDTIQQLTGQLAEADETAIALYEELEAARAGEPERPSEPVEETEDTGPDKPTVEEPAEPAEAGEVTE